LHEKLKENEVHLRRRLFLGLFIAVVYTATLFHFVLGIWAVVTVTTLYLSVCWPESNFLAALSGSFAAFLIVFMIVISMFAFGTNGFWAGVGVLLLSTPGIMAGLVAIAVNRIYEEEGVISLPFDWKGKPHNKPWLRRYVDEALEEAKRSR
tara:strand:- start:199 stop:651 length:453 start_codon:yes stop_codon:yes gene_type:complete